MHHFYRREYLKLEAAGSINLLRKVDEHRMSKVPATRSEKEPDDSRNPANPFELIHSHPTSTDSTGQSLIRNDSFHESGYTLMRFASKNRMNTTKERI